MMINLNLFQKLIFDLVYQMQLLYLMHLVEFTKGKEIGKHPIDEKPIVLKKGNSVTILPINQKLLSAQGS